MLNFFKTKKQSKENNVSEVLIASLLVHAARIDENYTVNEKEIIKKTLLKLGVKDIFISNIIDKAEEAEKDANQILEFTREAKNLDQEKKIILVEALWSIIYSDDNADIFEANLMRRISGLLYLDNKLVGSIKEKLKNKK